MSMTTKPSQRGQLVTISKHVKTTEVVAMLDHSYEDKHW